MRSVKQPQVAYGTYSGTAPAAVTAAGSGNWFARRTATGTVILTLPWTPVTINANSNSQGRAVSYTITGGSREATLICFLTSTLAADDQAVTFTATGPPA